MQGKEHQRNKDRYNDQAAAWIFNGALRDVLGSGVPQASNESLTIYLPGGRLFRARAENNKVQPQGSIDLHGLYVQEAIEYTEKAIAVRRCFAVCPLVARLCSPSEERLSRSGCR